MIRIHLLLSFCDFYLSFAISAWLFPLNKETYSLRNESGKYANEKKIPVKEVYSAK